MKLKDWIKELTDKELEIDANGFVIVCATEGSPLCVSSIEPALMHALINTIQDGTPRIQH